MLLFLLGCTEKKTRFCQDFDVVFPSWLYCKNKRFSRDFDVALAS